MTFDVNLNNANVNINVSFPTAPPPWLAPFLTKVFTEVLTPLFNQFEAKIMSALDDAISGITTDVTTLSGDATSLATDVTTLNTTIATLTAQVANGGTPQQIQALTDAQTQFAALHATLTSVLAQNPPAPAPVASIRKP